jgi:tetratricopeptide (TPR) repeat protein
MSYPGNPSLAPEIQNRILNTFRQTIELAEKGRLQEARLGCDFILKMDSQFAAARRLRERLDGASGPVRAADLEVGVGPGAPAVPAVTRAASEPPAPVTRSAPAAPVTRPAPVAPPMSSAEPPGASRQQAAGADPFADLAAAPADLDFDFDDFDLPDLSEEPAPEAPVAAAAQPGTGATPELPPEAAHRAPASPPATAADDLDLDLGDFDGEDLGFEEVAAQPRSPEGRDSGAAAPVDLLGGAAVGGPAAASSHQRIAELLAEGQAAFDRGEHQSAIDAWSRIFLIDIDHEEAGRRIEEARGLKAERERQVDEQLHEALRARDEGRLDDARAQLERLLASQPDNLAARDVLAQIQAAESGEPIAVAPVPEAPAAALDVAPPAAAAPSPPPRPVAAAPRPAFAGGAGQVRRGRSLPLVGAAVFVLALALAWFLYSNWGRLFPNAVEEVAAAPPAPSPLREANQLRLDGKVAEAIERLRAVPADDPGYAQSRTLLDQLEAEVAAAAAEEAAAAERDAARMASRQRLLEQARRAYDERLYLQAARAFRQADELAPLEGAAADLYRDTREQLLPIAQQVDLFRQREWELALPTLWRKLEENPGNRDVHQILADSYFNLAVRDLRRGDPGGAEPSLREVVELDPDDALAGRLYAFAQSYQQRPVDLLYRIFVGQLEFRQ